MILPSLVKSREDVTLDDLVAHVAEVAKELVVVSLTVGKALPFVVTIAEERLLTFGTNEMLNVPMFACQ